MPACEWAGLDPSVIEKLDRRAKPQAATDQDIERDQDDRELCVKEETGSERCIPVVCGVH